MKKDTLVIPIFEFLTAAAVQAGNVFASPSLNDMKEQSIFFLIICFVLVIIYIKKQQEGKTRNAIKS